MTTAQQTTKSIAVWKNAILAPKTLEQPSVTEKSLRGSNPKLLELATFKQRGLVAACLKCSSAGCFSAAGTFA